MWRGATTVRTRREAQIMATGETGFEDVTYDLIAVQYHALKAQCHG